MTPLEQRQKVSEALTKGVALFTAVLGILAARDGGIGRVVANAEGGVFVALACAVLSVLLAFTAWILVGAGTAEAPTKPWLLLIALSVVLLGASFLVYGEASTDASRKLERPSLTVKQRSDGLEFTARIDLLKADAFMRTTVYGYPPDDGPRELLFNSTSGPDADGRVSLTGVVQASLSNYEVVEVRAFRGDEDPGCERPRTGVQAAETGPAACASVWLVPLLGT